MQETKTSSTQPHFRNIYLILIVQYLWPLTARDSKGHPSHRERISEPCMWGVIDFSGYFLTTCMCNSWTLLKKGKNSTKISNTESYRTISNKYDPLKYWAQNILSALPFYWFLLYVYTHRQYFSFLVCALYICETKTKKCTCYAYFFEHPTDVPYFRPKWAEFSWSRRAIFFLLHF